jgi:hypothetical protein
VVREEWMSTVCSSAIDVYAMAFLGGGDRVKKTFLCELMLIVEPHVYISKREKKLGAGTEHVECLGLERWTDQIGVIGRDDVQVEVSI